MNWFNENGDKVLVGVAATATALGQAGVVASPWLAAATGIAALLHTLFWPDNTAAPAQTDQKK